MTLGKSPAPTTVARTKWAPFPVTAVAAVITAVPLVGQLYLVLPLTPQLSTSFGAGAARMAGMAFALAYAAGFIVLGPLGDRFRPRQVMVVSVLAAALGCVVVATAPSLTVLVTARALQGLASATFTPAFIVYISTCIEPRRRVAATSALVGSALASAVISQVVAQLVGDRWGWRPVFYCSAVALAAAATVLTRLPLSDRSQVRGSTAASYAALPRLLFHRRLGPLFLASTSYLMALVALYAALSAAALPDIDSSSAVLALRASALPGVIAAPFVANFLAPRISPRRRLLFFTALAGACFGAAAPHVAAWWIALTLGAAVTSIAIAAPAMIAVILEVAAEQRAVAAAMYMCAIFMGASLGPTLASALAPTGFGSVAAASALALLAATVLSAAATRGRKTQASADHDTTTAEGENA